MLIIQTDSMQITNQNSYHCYYYWFRFGPFGLCRHQNTHCPLSSAATVSPEFIPISSGLHKGKWDRTCAIRDVSFADYFEQQQMARGQGNVKSAAWFNSEKDKWITKIKGDEFILFWRPLKLMSVSADRWAPWTMWGIWRARCWWRWRSCTKASTRPLCQAALMWSWSDSLMERSSALPSTFGLVNWGCCAPGRK